MNPAGEGDREGTSDEELLCDDVDQNIGDAGRDGLDPAETGEPELDSSSTSGVVPATGKVVGVAGRLGAVLEVDPPSR